MAYSKQSSVYGTQAKSSIKHFINDNPQLKQNESFACPNNFLL